MCRKLIFLISFVLVLGLVNVASSIDWKGPGTEWDVGTNWVGGVVPGPEDEATIDGTMEGPTIDCDVNVGHISGPHGAGQVITVTGGHIVTHNNWVFGSDDGMATIDISGSPIIEVLGPGYYGRGWWSINDGAGTINISGDPNIYVESGIRGADETGSALNIYMSGGQVNCDMLLIGDNGSGNFYLTGGKFNCRGEFKIRGRGGAFFTVQIGGEGSPAELIIGGVFLSPEESEAGALINLDNGYIECASWEARGENWILDINEGLLRIKNAPEFYPGEEPPEPYIDHVQGWIDAGQITGYNNTETPQVTTDGADIVVTVHFVHEKAYAPSPEHKETDVCPANVELSWTPGEYVADTNGNDIYLGTDDSDVNESATPVRVGHDTNTWAPGPLEIGKTYYWRVDTVKLPPDPCTWRGGIWEFRTDNGRAYDPYPTNGMRGIAYAEVSPLSWTPSCVADYHYVYMGMPGSIVLFEDDFEDGFDPNWAATTGWSIYDATADENFADHNNNLARAVAGTMTSGDIDASDANSINVSFVIRLAKGAGAGAVTLNYYNGATYVPVADWNSLDPCDTWLGYGDTITDSQYTEISNFRIQLVSTLTGPNSVYINNVRVTNNWPIAAEYYQGQTSDSNWPVSVDPWKPYSWRIDTITTGGQKTQGPRWTFQTGLGGLLLYYKFDNGPGSLPDPIYDDSGNNVRFDKYTNSGGTAVYGESNPVLVSSSYGAVFDPNAGLHRFDPCAPDEIEPFRLSGYQHTVELWVKPTRLDSDMDIDDDDWADSDDDICLIGKFNAWGIYIDGPGGQNAYKFRQSDNGETLEDDTAKVDEWAHLALVYDQTAEDSYQCYLNGLLKESADEGMNSSSTTYPVTIGYARRDDVNLGRFFEGVIDEVRIYDIALTPCEFLITPGPEWASCPNPSDGSSELDPCTVKLMWTPGQGAVSHDVYFSSDFDEVSGAGATAVETSWGPNSWTPPTTLGDGTVYYWRIDTYDASQKYEGVIWRFTTMYVVKDTHLILWYQFDETSGDDAMDASGYGHHGDVDEEDNWDPTGGQFGGCLIFDDDQVVLPPIKVTSYIGSTSAVSVSVWLNGLSTQQSGEDMTIFDIGTTEAAPYGMMAYVPDENGDVYWRAGNDTNDVLVWNDATPRGWKGDWHHFVFVKDESAGTMSIWFDGSMVESKTGVISSLSNFFYNPFKIGSVIWGSADYEGKMDDFRVYDYALPKGKIEELFRGGELALAWKPRPYDGHPEAPFDSVLIWEPGNYASSHDVYFGTNKTAVEDANSTYYPGVDHNNVDVNTYDPGILELGQTYYWRIDEVNDTCDPNGWRGNLWRFTVAEYITIDDFEKYDTGYAAEQPGSWEDGGDNGTGSTIEFGDSGWGQVRGGEMSMIYWYDTWAGFGYYSEAATEALNPTDWASPGVKMLSLWFYGDPLNDATYLEQMYVGLKDTSDLYAYVDYGEGDEDMNDIQIEDWQEWNIPLSSFTDVNDVNLADVEKLYIGFGISGGDEEGGDGTVYFDDIRLYQPTCILSKRPTEFAELDLNDDCIIDFGDIEVMAEDWLDSDVNLGEVEEPCDANLVGWWELDEGDGNVAGDSSGNDYNGVIETIDEDVWWVAGRDDVNNALEFDGGWVSVPNEVTPKLNLTDAVTVCCWINRAESADDDMQLVCKGRNDWETYSLEVSEENRGRFFVRDANDVDNQYTIDSQDELPVNSWVHVAGTYDGNELTLYVNGQVAANSVHPLREKLTADANDGLGIAGRWGDTGGSFIGTIDDVRIYDYGLSAEEVAYLATDGTGILSLESVANLYQDGAVNFKDFAELADNWLRKEFWP